MNDTNPYQSPKSEVIENDHSKLTSGDNANTIPCKKCGSTNTKNIKSLYYRPNGIYFLIFGWFYILARIAFTKKIIVCNDCGIENSFKTIGSWIAMATLIFLLSLIFYSAR